MAKSIATFAQWNENVVDLGKTITLTINGVGSVRFEDYADFAISILGPVTNKKVNMPPDAFIGKTDESEDWYYDSITINGKLDDIMNMPEANDGDVVVVTWKQYAPKPEPIENETWLWFQRPYGDTWKQPMKAFLIPDKTYTDKNTWITVDRFGTELDRVYSVHVPDGTYHMLPMIYDTGNSYRAMNPKTITINHTETGGYSYYSMHWMSLRYPGESESNYRYECQKGNKSVGYLAVFDNENSYSGDTYTIDIILNDPGTSASSADEVYFSTPQYADDWERSEEYIRSDWKPDDHLSPELIHTNNAILGINRMGGNFDNPEYDFPHTIGCLVLDDDSVHFAKMNKGGGQFNFSKLPLRDNDDLIMYVMWFYNSELRPDETLPKHSRDEMLEDSVYHVTFSSAGSPTSRIAARGNIYTFTNDSATTVNQFEYYQMEVNPDYRLNIPSAVEAKIKNDHIGVVIDSLYDYPILMNKNVETGRFEMTFEGGVGFSKYLNQMYLTLDSWGMTESTTDMSATCSVYTRRYWLEVEQTDGQLSGTVPGFNIIIHGDTHDINPEFITPDLIKIDCNNLDLKIKSVTHFSSTEQGDHTICVELLNNFGVNVKEYIIVKLLGEYIGFNFSRGSHSGGTNREIGILKFTPDNLVSYEELNSK